MAVAYEEYSFSILPVVSRFKIYDNGDIVPFANGWRKVLVWIGFCIRNLLLQQFLPHGHLYFFFAQTGHEVCYQILVQRFFETPTSQNKCNAWMNFEIEESEWEGTLSLYILKMWNLRSFFSTKLDVRLFSTKLIWTTV